MTEDDRKLQADIKPFGLRMQPVLRAQIEAVARANNRSMNAEIVARLEQSFTIVSDLSDVTSRFYELLELSGQQSKMLEAAAARENDLSDRLVNMTDALNTATESMGRLMDKFLEREAQLIEQLKK